MKNQDIDKQHWAACYTNITAEKMFGKQKSRLTNASKNS